MVYGTLNGTFHWHDHWVTASQIADRQRWRHSVHIWLAHLILHSRRLLLSVSVRQALWPLSASQRRPVVSEVNNSSQAIFLICAIFVPFLLSRNDGIPCVQPSCNPSTLSIPCPLFLSLLHCIFSQVPYNVHRYILWRSALQHLFRARQSVLSFVASRRAIHLVLWVHWHLATIKTTMTRCCAHSKTQHDRQTPLLPFGGERGMSPCPCLPLPAACVLLQILHSGSSASPCCLQKVCCKEGRHMEIIRLNYSERRLVWQLLPVRLPVDPNPNPPKKARKLP